MSPASARTGAHGYTMVELLVTIGIIAILAAVIYPSYTAYVQRGNRASAKVALEQTAQYMERKFTTDNAYPTTLPVAYTGAPLTVPPTQQTYTIALDTGSSTTAFIVKATPNNSKVDPTCGTLRLDNLGNQRALDHAISAGATSQDASCWAR